MGNEILPKRQTNSSLEDHAVSTQERNPEKFHNDIPHPWKPKICIYLNTGQATLFQFSLHLKFWNVWSSDLNCFSMFCWFLLCGKFSNQHWSRCDSSSTVVNLYPFLSCLTNSPRLQHLEKNWGVMIVIYISQSFYKDILYVFYVNIISLLFIILQYYFY